MKFPRLTIAAAIATLSALLAGCTDDSPEAAEPNTTSPATSEPSTTSPPTDEPTEQGSNSLRDYAGPITPGTHRVPLISWDRTYPVDALIEVPDGFITPGGWVIENNENGAAYGDLMFFGDVDHVATQPCGTGRLVEPGPAVQDLADALTSQVPGWGIGPTPVKLGRYRGLYLETRAPADVSGCPGKSFTLWGVDQSDESGYDVNPGAEVHLWIVDVDGQRVVVAARVDPDRTVHGAEILEMAEGTRFVEYSPA